MIILNAGVPRSGTVLVNAIIRELLRGVSQGVVQSNPNDAELVKLVRYVQQTGRHIHSSQLIHTHSWGPEVSKRLSNEVHLRAVVNYRDPRDVCVSLIKLHENDLALTMPVVETCFALMEDCARDTGALVLPYELLASYTPAAIFQIARHLGLWPGLDRVAEIAEATSIDKHRTIMEEVQAGTREKLQRRANRLRVLVEDKVTLINDRHIQSGISGRWKTELTDEQQQIVNARFKPILQKYGYEQVDASA